MPRDRYIGNMHVIVQNTVVVALRNNDVIFGSAENSKI